MKLLGRGQVSMEYLAIFSIAALMTIPLILIFVVQSGNIRSDITNTQIQKAASEIIDSAKEVYFMGPPAQKTIKLTFPNDIQEIVIDSNSINFTIQTAVSEYTLIKDSSFNITGNLDKYPGPHIVIITAHDGYVNITDK